MKVYFFSKLVSSHCFHRVAHLREVRWTPHVTKANKTLPVRAALRKENGGYRTALQDAAALRSGPESAKLLGSCRRTRRAGR